MRRYSLGTFVLAFWLMLMCPADAGAFEFLGFSFGSTSSMEELGRRIQIDPQSAIEDLDRRITEEPGGFGSDMAYLYFLRAGARSNLPESDWAAVGADLTVAISMFPPLDEDVQRDELAAVYAFRALSYVRLGEGFHDKALSDLSESERLYGPSFLSKTVRATIAYQNRNMPEAYKLATEAIGMTGGSTWLEPRTIQARSAFHMANRAFGGDSEYWRSQYAYALTGWKGARSMRQAAIQNQYNSIAGTPLLDYLLMGTIVINQTLHEVLPGQAPLNFAISIYGYDVVSDPAALNKLTDTERLKFYLKALEGLKDWVPSAGPIPTRLQLAEKWIIERTFKKMADAEVELLARALATNKESAHFVHEIILILNRMRSEDFALVIVRDGPKLMRLTLEAVEAYNRSAPQPETLSMPDAAAIEMLGRIHSGAKSGSFAAIKEYAKAYIARGYPNQGHAHTSPGGKSYWMIRHAHAECFGVLIAASYLEGDYNASVRLFSDQYALLAEAFSDLNPTQMLVPDPRTCVIG